MAFNPVDKDWRGDRNCGLCARRTVIDMIPRYSRLSLLLIILLLATPLVVGLARPENAEHFRKEGRTAAPAPSVPRSLDDLATLPKETDDYLDDRFGLREQMVRWYSNLTKRLLGEGNQQVLVGRHDRMFYLGDVSVQQSAGLVRRDARVAETIGFLIKMRDLLTERGIRLVVASPPNAATIYQDDLPRWARSNGRTTEYDLFVADLAARGIKAIDLRPIVWAARNRAPAYFLYDTHWTPRAAIAGFNGVVEADGHPEWRVDADAALAPLTQRHGGDLARMLGVSDDVAEPYQEAALPPMSKVELPAQPFPSYVATRDKPGETIMIIGELFHHVLFRARAA